MANKNILIISYYFPPFNTVAIHRVLRFSKYLPENGWTPYILTIEESKGMRNLDRDLLYKVTPFIEVYRTFTLDPQLLITKLIEKYIVKHKESKRDKESKVLGIKKIIKNKVSFLKKNRMLRFIFFPDSQVLWLPFAVFKGYHLIKKLNIRIIFATAPPWTDFLIGYCLSLLTGKKLVIDYRDLWIANPVLKFPTPVHEQLSQKLEHLFIRQAYKVICVTELITINLIQNYPDMNEKFITITNGFDSYWPLKQATTNEPKGSDINNKKLRLVYTGTFYLSHTPENFLHGLHDFVTNHPNYRGKIEFIFIGHDNNTSIFQEKVFKYGLSDIVISKGFLNYRSAYLEVEKADVAVLIIQPEHKEAFTGKVFDYFAARKPILAVVPEDGIAAKLIKNTKTGIVADSGNIKAITNAISHYFKLWKSGSIYYERDESELEKYNMRNITKRLAELLNEC